MRHSLETVAPPRSSLNRRRRLKVRDAERNELEALALAVAPQHLCRRYEMSSALLKRNLQGAIDRGDGVIVAEDGSGRACGFAWYRPTGTFGSGAYLELIALEPGAEGRGLGGALLDEIERRLLADRAMAAPTLFLLVSHWNHGARRFYASHGYQEQGLLRGFRRADTDEIVCMKRLAD